MKTIFLLFIELLIFQAGINSQQPQKKTLPIQQTHILKVDSPIRVVLSNNDSLCIGGIPTVNMIQKEKPWWEIFLPILISPLIGLFGVYIGYRINKSKETEFKKEDRKISEIDKLTEYAAEAASLIPELKHHVLECLKGNGCSAYLSHVEDQTPEEKLENDKYYEKWQQTEKEFTDKFLQVMKQFRKQIELFNSKLEKNDSWNKNMQKLNEFRIDQFTLAKHDEVKDEGVVWDKAHHEANRFINTIVEPIIVFMKAYISALENGEEKHFNEFIFECVVSLDNPTPRPGSDSNTNEGKKNG